MKKTDDHASMTSSIKEIPEIRLSYDDVLDLLGAESLPGTSAQREILIRMTSKVVRDKGEDYVRRNGRLLADQWRMIQHEIPATG